MSPDGRRGQHKHRPGCPSKEEIIKAYEDGVADETYTREWLEALDCSPEEINSILSRHPQSLVEK